jgi:hypothetical protein
MGLVREAGAGNRDLGLASCNCDDNLRNNCIYIPSIKQRDLESTTTYSPTPSSNTQLSGSRLQYVGPPSFQVPQACLVEQCQHQDSRRLCRRSSGRHPTAANLSVPSSSPLSQFSLGFYILIDCAVWSASGRNPSQPPVHITFVDWIPGICSALGMLVINSIDKSRLSADSFSYSGNGVAWKARLVLFLGFALLAGGLAGSVTVLVLKYVVREYALPTLWMGIGNVVANGLVMLR